MKALPKCGLFVTWKLCEFLIRNYSMSQDKRFIQDYFCPPYQD
jgi:hypothetical protein